MFECSECGGTAPSWDAHVCPLARGGQRGPRPVAAQPLPGQGVPLQQEAAQIDHAPQPRGLLDLLDVDEDKLDRVLAKLERLAAMDEEGVFERLERIAALQEKIRL